MSIIIPTLNRARLLDRTLFSLSNQVTDQNFEVVVVDNGSNDSTCEIVGAYKSKLSNLIYLYDDRPGLLVGRHIGAQKAIGDIISFIDDDVIIPPYWLQGIYEVFAGNNEIRLATGNNYPFFECPPPEWLNHMWCKCGSNGKYLYQLSLLCLGNQGMSIDSSLVWGVNFHIRRNLFVESGGFHPDSVPSKFLYFIGDGEVGITKKMKERGINAYFDPRLSLYHTATTERLTKEYFIRRSFTEGMMTAYTDLKSSENVVATIELLSQSENKMQRSHAVRFNTRNFLLRVTSAELFAFKKDIRMSFVAGYCNYISHISTNPSLIRYVEEKDYLDIDKLQAEYYSKL